jgi:hypothetical protein
VVIDPAGLDALAGEVQGALAAAGIEINTAGHGISMTFPSPENHP